MSPQNRYVGMGDVLFVLISLPLAILGLGWLAFVTDLSIIRENGLMFLILAALIYIFSRLNYYFLVQIRSDRTGSSDGSLAGAIEWSGIFLFGPSILWLSVINQAIIFLTNWRGNISNSSRWSYLRNFSMNLSVTTIASLAALSIYQRWGGVYPIPGLTLQSLLLALTALTIYFLISVLLWLGYLAYGVWIQVRLTQSDTFAPLLRFIVLALVLPFLALPFSILLAGLYSQSGIEIYLFFVIGLFLVAIITRRLSWAVESSRQTSRQLEQLEQLGRNLLRTTPDISTLENLLHEFVPRMFPAGRVILWLEEQGYLHKHPEEWKIDIQPIWYWVKGQNEAASFHSGEALPWMDRYQDHRPVVLAPIFEMGRNEPVGCIYIELHKLSQPWHTKALESLFPAIHSLADQIVSTLHQEEIYYETLEYQKAVQELEFAGRIQESFLPKEVPLLPDWELAVTLLPVRNTSGDYFDFIPLENGKIGILIADVADKGLGAALYMALSRTLIRTYALEYGDRPDLVFFSTNERILRDARANLFVTAFYGVLDQESGTLTYCNAGHNPPFLMSHRSGNNITALTITGMPLGVDEDVYWKQETINIAPGDVLLLYTDGIPDAQNFEGAFFKETKLIEVAASMADSSAQEIQKAVLNSIEAFVGDAQQFDDITLIVLMRNQD